MRRSRGQRGEGNFGCLVGIVLLLAGIFVAYKLIPIKVKAADLRQTVFDESKSGGNHNDDRIMKVILKKAEDLDLSVRVGDDDIIVDEKIRIVAVFMLADFEAELDVLLGEVVERRWPSRGPAERYTRRHGRRETDRDGRENKTTDHARNAFRASTARPGKSLNRPSTPASYSALNIAPTSPCRRGRSGPCGPLCRVAGRK